MRKPSVRRRIKATQAQRMSAEGRVWDAMITRCTNPRNSRFADYGGRGIRVCERWLSSFEDFLDDMGPRPSPDYSLDRIDNDGHYEPGNCRWATRSEQSANQRPRSRGVRLLTVNGETKSLSEWARAIGIAKQVLAIRIDSLGWSVEEACTTPPRPRRANRLGSARNVAHRSEANQ